MLDKAHQRVKLHHVGGVRLERLRQKRLRRHGAAGVMACAPSRLSGSKLHGPVDAEHSGGEIADVERLQGMSHQHRPDAPGGAVGPSDGAVHNVEELGDRHGWGTLVIGALVPPAERDDEVLGRGQHGVE